MPYSLTENIVIFEPYDPSVDLAKTPKDVLTYVEFNGELRMIITRTDCCYLAMFVLVLT